MPNLQPAIGTKIFHLVMIKPTHYDDDGYPIIFKRSRIPSNSLACVNSLAMEARRCQALGPDVDIRLYTHDEVNRRVVPKRIIRMIRESGGKALIAFIGVQSNQFPHAVDLAKHFLAAGLPVCIGGFHVSGCTSMLPEMPPEMREAQKLGISFFCGEAENGRLDELMRDTWAGQLKPMYNYMDDLPGLDGQPAPFLPNHEIERIQGRYSSMDLGRGCPFQCSFCTIINVQGRKSRYRTPDDVERIIRQNYAQGIKRFFITDDNFARNRDWEKLFDRIIYLREKEGLEIGFIIQVDTLAHKIPDFIEKAQKAGIQYVFVGLENINPDNLLAAKKRQNKITDYRIMLQKWRGIGAVIYAGYILGFPADTKESILRDVEIIKRELPVDILEFFFLTPLPGSEDHQVLTKKGAWMDSDLNKYALDHRVAHHGKMTDSEWEEAYHAAWHSYYSPDHLRTILRRAAAHPSGKPLRTCKMMAWFYTAVLFEGIHPLEVGESRLKYRRDRRPTMPIEHPLMFYPRRYFATAIKYLRMWNEFRKLWAMLKQVKNAPDRYEYRDLAITPPGQDEFEALDLYHQTHGGEAALARMRRDDAIRNKTVAVAHAEPLAGAAG